MKKYTGLIISCVLLLIVVLGIYLPLTRTFYQQDEWYGYGTYLAKGPEMIFSSATYLSKDLGSIFLKTNGLINIFLGEGRIFTRLSQYMFYKYFPLNASVIALFSIILHLANTILIFFLAKKTFKKTLVAFLGSLFFAVNSVSQSAITWSAASVNTLPSTFLILVSILFFINYIDDGKRWLIYSFISIYLSLFFRETGIFLFLLLPVFSLFFQKYSITRFIKRYWYFFLTLSLIVAFRLYEFKSTPNDVALFLTGSSKYFLDAMLVRSVLYPLTSFSLSIVPPDIFLNFARYITNVYYPFIPEAQFILIAQTIVLDLLALFLNGIILFISLLMFKKSDKNIQKQIVFWFIFLLASFLPYVIISKSYSYLESRYYYVGSIAWSMIFSWFFYVLFNKIKTKYIYLLPLSIYLAFIFVHIKTVRTDITKLVDESQTRINILNQISIAKPRLENKKNVFYITGDTDYYLVGNKIPFQQGFGYTLLTFYLPKSNYPDDLLNNTDLFEIGREGYYEGGEYGFGYFSNIKKLKETIKKYNLEENQVSSFYYDSKNEKLIPTNTIHLLKI